MSEWSFFTNHARVLISIAHDPGVRLRDIATAVGITERSAYAIVTDLTAAGYVVKDKHTDARRNRYQIQTHLPLREAIGPERTIGEVLAVLVDSNQQAAQGMPCARALLKCREGYPMSDRGAVTAAVPPPLPVVPACSDFGWRRSG
jgi:hypothetical protein